MSNFKIGDWVKSTKYLHLRPLKVQSIYESNERKGDFGLKSEGQVLYDSECELWQPKEGELIISKDKNGIITVEKYLNQEVFYPFIGEITWLQKED